GGAGGGGGERRRVPGAAPPAPMPAAATTAALTSTPIRLRVILAPRLSSVLPADWLSASCPCRCPASVRRLIRQHVPVLPLTARLRARPGWPWPGGGPQPPATTS